MTPLLKEIKVPLFPWIFIPPEKNILFMVQGEIKERDEASTCIFVDQK